MTSSSTSTSQSTSSSSPSSTTADIGYSAAAYEKSQVEALRNRILSFEGGRLYLEVGGKFLYDGHASRVLPGFDPRCKPGIIRAACEGGAAPGIIMCASAPDIATGRVWGSGETYASSLLNDLRDIEASGLPRPLVAINMLARGEEPHPAVGDVIAQLKGAGYSVTRRYLIEGYPKDVERICSPEGFGLDEAVPVPEDAKLVCVVAVGSNSGKMSTALGQVYHDLHGLGLTSGYAKYELFPIHDLPLDHPVNLAYEAATADIGDYNLIDPFQLAEAGVESVNYNRDVEAFPLLRALIDGVCPGDSPMRRYTSPTAMGVNTASSGVMGDGACRAAGEREVHRRRESHVKLRREMAERGREGQSAVQEKAVRRCDELLEKCTAERDARA